MHSSGRDERLACHVRRIIRAEEGGSTGDFFGTIFDDLVDLELLNLLIEGVESLFASFS